MYLKYKLLEVGKLLKFYKIPLNFQQLKEKTNTKNDCMLNRGLASCFSQVIYAQQLYTERKAPKLGDLSSITGS